MKPKVTFSNPVQDTGIGHCQKFFFNNGLDLLVVAHYSSGKNVGDFERAMLTSPSGTTIVSVEQDNVVFDQGRTKTTQPTMAAYMKAAREYVHTRLRD